MQVDVSTAERVSDTNVSTIQSFKNIGHTVMIVSSSLGELWMLISLMIDSGRG